MSVAEDNLAVALLRFEQCCVAFEPLLEVGDDIAVVALEDEME
jgi:hypothetical protein